MGRPPLPVGTFGRIHLRVLGKGRVEARASFRDFGGRRRLVARHGQSRAEAERRLREALRDRSGTTTPGTADSRLAAMAREWLADIDAAELAARTKRPAAHPLTDVSGAFGRRFPRRPAIGLPRGLPVPVIIGGRGERGAPLAEVAAQRR